MGGEIRPFFFYVGMPYYEKSHHGERKMANGEKGKGRSKNQRLKLFYLLFYLLVYLFP